MEGFTKKFVPPVEPCSGCGPLYSFSSNVNPDVSSKFFNKGPTDFDTNERIRRDTALNDGSDLGSTYDCGALEAAVIMRVDV